MIAGMVLYQRNQPVKQMHDPMRHNNESHPTCMCPENNSILAKCRSAVSPTNTYDKYQMRRTRSKQNGKGD